MKQATYFEKFLVKRFPCYVVSQIFHAFRSMQYSVIQKIVRLKNLNFQYFFTFSLWKSICWTKSEQSSRYLVPKLTLLVSEKCTILSQILTTKFLMNSKKKVFCGIALNSFPHAISKKEKKTWHRNRVSVLQFCRSVKKKWRFSRYFSDTQIWREKRSSENKTSLSHRNILKWENLFRSLSGFWEKKIAIRVCSIRSENSYRFFIKVISIF